MRLGGAQLWWGGLALLMGLGVWLGASGSVTLWGPPLALLEALARGQGVVALGAAQWGDGVLAGWPGDLLAWSCGLLVLANLAGALTLYLAGCWTWKSAVSPLFAVGIAYFAERTLWINTSSPGESLTHLAMALALAAVLRGTVALLGFFLIVVALLSAPKAVMLLPAFAYLAFRRQAAYGLVVPSIALLGAGCLLIPLAGGYRLEVGLSGWSYLTLVPLLLPLLSPVVRAARGGIYLGLLLGSALTGEAELASLLAWADLAFLAEKSLQSADSQQTFSGFKIRRDGLFLLGASLALWAVTLPGERYLNRQVLIPAQKARVPFSELWRFFSLDRHARRSAQDSWRGVVPFPQMSPRDFEVALELPQQPGIDSAGFCLLTMDQMAEARQDALLYALLANRPLRGWDGPNSLAGPLLLCKLRGENLIQEGPVLVLRRQGQAELARPASALSGPLAELDLRRITVMPYRAQQVSRESGGGYRFLSSAGEFTVVFGDGPVEVMLSCEPGEVRVISLHPSGAVRHLEIPRFGARLSQLPEEALPSRSLLPLKLRLENTGELPFSSEMLVRWRLQASGDNAFTQVPAKGFLLFPGESTELELELATPQEEGLLWLEATAITPDGQELRVEVEQAAPLRTWRRTPPVGTWREEP